MNKKQERALRSEIRDIISEEVSPNTKQSLLEDLESEIRSCMDSVLMDHNVEVQGLSDGQVSWLFHRLDDVVKEKLAEYQTTSIRDADLRRAAEEYASQR